MGCGFCSAISQARKLLSRWAAIAVNPQMSDRAIAADIGVHKNTVARARQATGP
jgi:hypothetical protein